MLQQPVFHMTPRPGQLAVEHFIDYLYARYQHKDTLTEDFFSLSAEAWDND